MNKNFYLISATIFTILIIVISGCRKNKPLVEPEEIHVTTPYKISFPNGMNQSLFEIPVDNPLTVEGVALGKKLFFDVRLSGDNTLSCGSCHFPEKAFTDGDKRFSTGIDGKEGDRNSMALFNLAYNKDYFWNGRSTSLEAQILEPVINPLELHQTWKDAMDKIKADELYRQMFKAAFNKQDFDSTHAAKAIAQFLRTIISGNSRFNQQFNKLSPSEKKGFNVFQSETLGDCAHCHPADIKLFTDNYFSDINQRFHNNGLLPDLPPGTFIGRAEYTKNPKDNGMFKTPSLLNIALTAPYMHDGRFKTLEEVVDFYDTGVHENSNLDNSMGTKSGLSRTFENGKRHLNSLSVQDKADLVAFLKCLTDSSFLMNPDYRP